MPAVRKSKTSAAKRREVANIGVCGSAAAAIARLNP
jgi:hypothetical protein